MFNLCILTGRLVRDPKSTEFGAETSVCNFRIANSLGKNKKGVELTQYVNCKAWNKTGKIVMDLAKQGTLVNVQGTINSEEYKADDGSTRYTIYINVKLFQFIRHPKSVANEQTLPPTPDS